MKIVSVILLSLLLVPTASLAEPSLTGELGYVRVSFRCGKPYPYAYVDALLDKLIASAGTAEAATATLEGVISKVDTNWAAFPADVRQTRCVDAAKHLAKVNP